MDNIELNVHFSTGDNSSPKNKESKHDRLKRIRSDRQKKLQESNTQKISKTIPKIVKKISNQRHDADHGKDDTNVSKFSSLFRNNPEIPQIPGGHIEQVSEQVFSGKSVNELDLHPHMIANLEQRFNVTQLTAVQNKAIPCVLAGRDVMVKSQTGSGKTFCYAIPMVQHLQAIQPHISRADGLYALIIVPTRELALQSYDTLHKLVQPYQWIVPGCVMGGESKAREKKRIKKGINVLISTPGRLLDHLQNTQCLDIARVQYVVIDEADRLLDMGFERDVKQILSNLNEKCTSTMQTILLSATLSHSVERLAGLSLTDPVRIYVTESASQEVGDNSTPEAELFATPDSLKHHLVVVPSKLRLVTLAAFILWKVKYTNKNKKMVVFVATHDSVEFHSHVLSSLEDTDNSLGLFKLHGDMPQKERTKVFNEFSRVESGVLLCTDVAARGLDLPHVRWIVQYDTPASARDYIHRVGRTARIGSQGHALLFLSPAEVDYVKVLQKYKISFNELQVDDILKTLLIETHNNPKLAASTRVHTVQESATQLQRRLEDLVESDTAVRTLARKAYSSSVRAYATHASEEKHIFHVRSLHLGHVAKSFALKDKPTNIGGIVSRTGSSSDSKFKRKSSFGDIKGGPPRKRFQSGRDVSEFSSGIDSRTSLNVSKSMQPKNKKQINTNIEKNRNKFKSKPKRPKK